MDKDGDPALLKKLHITIIGLPGAGKTTIGRRVAKALRFRFLDIDKEIERSVGLRVSEIFATQGEKKFRELEVEASRIIAGTDQPRIISTGGGWAMNESAVAHLRSISRIIYLRVSPIVAFKRVNLSKGSRPLLAGPDALAVLEHLFEKRRAAYEALADIHIDASGHSDQVVKSILDQIKHERRL